MGNPLFAKKPVKLLLEEMEGENRLRRILGPVQLSSLGIGAIIGTGIFVLTGVAAHDKTGPALILSFVVAGLACIFAALCYAEFASMVPVAGSAYTYAYATLGELFAWIVGWDLILEYAVASATVAHGWSHYFQDFIGIFGIKLPFGITNAPFDFDPGASGPVRDVRDPALRGDRAAGLVEQRLGAVVLVPRRHAGAHAGAAGRALAKIPLQPPAHGLRGVTVGGEHDD